MRKRRMCGVARMAFALLAALGLIAGVGSVYADDQGGRGEPVFKNISPLNPEIFDPEVFDPPIVAKLMFPRYLIGYARSDTETGTETVAVVTNTGDKDARVRVDWLYALGGPDNLAGTSGTVTIGPKQDMHFVTANAGGSVEPFFMNAPRDTNYDFDGRAKVYADSSDIVVNAILLVGNGSQDGGASLNYHDLKVFEIVEKKGIQHGD